jgi:hypothetical protein
MASLRIFSSALLGFALLAGLVWPGAVAQAQATEVFAEIRGGVDVVPPQQLSHPSFVTLSANGLFAESNLSTGEVKASSSKSGPDSTGPANVFTGMTIVDFQIVGPGVAPLPLTLKVTGTFSRSLGARSSVGQGAQIYFAAVPNGGSFSGTAKYDWQYSENSESVGPPFFVSRPNAQGASSVTVTTATPTAMDVTLAVSLVPGVKYTIVVQVLTSANETGAASALIDLSHTAKLSLSLPAGYSHTSNGGLFLSVPPAITTQPANVTVSAGSLATFSVLASGQPAPSYQWRKDGVPLAGATGTSFTLPSTQSSDAGGYSVIVSNSLGSVTSSTAALVVAPPPNPGRLINLSIRSPAGTGAQTLTTGAVIGGAGTSGPKPLLIRGTGPALGAFGVTGFLVDPTSSVFSGATVIASNDNWGGDALVASIGTLVGAFPLTPATSKDAALYQPALSPGAYTIQLAGVGGTTGITLAEIYDATPTGSFTATTPRLINVSARTQVGTGADILIAGFVIGGATPKTLLIRAIGPTLAVFGVPGALVDPKLELYAGSAKTHENDNWGGTGALSAAFGLVGAFPLDAVSKDAVLLVTLPPGSYTAQVSGVGGTTGVALVEVYDVP